MLGFFARTFLISRQYPGGGPALGLLVVRIVFGVGIALHGIGKIENPTGWMNAFAGENAPPAAAQAAAAYSEFVGGLMLAAGLFTRFHAILLVGTMAVAAGMAHISQGDPFYRSFGEKDAPVVFFEESVNYTLPDWLARGGADAGKWEPAAMYFAAAVLLTFVGPGLLSLDRLLFGPVRPKPDDRS